LGWVPRVSGLEGFHCIAHKTILLITHHVQAFQSASGQSQVTESTAQSTGSRGLSLCS